MKRVSIVQYGLGQVGQALLGQIVAGREALAARTGLELRHVALADSRGALVDPGGLSDSRLSAALAGKREGVPLQQQPGGAAHTGALDLAPLAGGTILVDVTAADGMGAIALQALERGWGVVLANKRPLAGDLEIFRRLTASRRLRHEATVGAGLPWLEMLTHLLDTGDRVTSLEATVSGTLGFICYRLQQGVAFSAAVAEAKALGYTEPDPRDDLSAADVRRKALILARLLGLPLSWEDVPAEALYPPEWNALTIDGFMERTPELDAALAECMAAASARGRTLRYSVEIAEGCCRVGLHEVEKAGPLGALQGPTCLLALHTQRYHPTPLVISGPGAGAAVTAAGVYADILSLSVMREAAMIRNK